MSAVAHRPGFTLTELLIVAVILAAVLTLLVKTASYIRDRGLSQWTVGLIGRVGQALAQYNERDDARGYPPDQFGGWIQPTGEHRARTEGAECLYRRLSRQKLFVPGSDPRAVANTDGDRDMRDNFRALEELVDGWGRPLLYYNGYGADPAGSEAGRPLPKEFAAAGERTEWLNLSLANRWTLGGRRPLVDSAGPDGRFDTADDLRLAGRRRAATAEEDTREGVE